MEEPTIVIVKVPPPIMVHMGVQRSGAPKDKQVEQMNFGEWLTIIIDANEKTQRGRAIARQARRIHAVAKGITKKTKTIRLCEEDIDLINQSADAFTTGPGINRQLVPFYDALDEAEPINKPKDELAKESGEVAA